MMVNVQGSRPAIDNNEYVVILIALKAGLYTDCWWPRKHKNDDHNIINSHSDDHLAITGKAGRARTDDDDNIYDDNNDVLDSQHLAIAGQAGHAPRCPTSRAAR